MDYSNISVRASIRALETVVRPAVQATADAQAQDQLGLVVDALRFLEHRMSILPQRDEFSTRTAVHLAGELAGVVASTDPDIAAELRSACREEDATGVVRDLLRSWPSLVDEDTRRSIARLVLASERRRVEADRAWFAPLGFDPEPESIPSLTEAWS
ncbi:hypothetical protein [Rhodococcus sp. T7]|uniref:hypothetical protein n=1 Tax=Rhodococcus sp. T7 TaxID=627444 RepID=UPI001357C775|nr:hypothetical protein [Rhodococcus sp. T7]KAF0957161.1 hypothetical protein MLGJGCBP_08991 [Rhodococcus sp. T7]KAF0958999.1 hypothetical protein MLGJGCBP_07876 [Rhodococcus sp. T7]